MDCVQSDRILQWVGFAVSLPAALMAGLSTAFDVYAISIKETFQYTQSEVELIASLGVAGVGLCFLQPILKSQFGYRVTYVVALVFSTASCVLVYVGTLFPSFFSRWPVLIGLFLCLTNLGNNMFMLQVYEIGVSNFDEKYSGKIIGVYSGISGLGKIVCCGLFEGFFYGNLGGCFLTIAILMAVNGGLCLMLHRPLSREDEALALTDRGANLSEDKQIPGTTNKKKDEIKDSTEEKQILLDKTNQRLGVKSMLKSVYFHMMFWSSVVFFSVFLSFLNNLTYVWDSAGVKNPLVSVYFMCVIMVGSRVLMGLIYDILASEKYGFILLHFTYLCFVIAMIIGLTGFNSNSVYVVTFLVAVAASGGNTLPWAMLSSHFGRHNLSIIMGGFYGSGTIVVLSIQAFVGFAYDSEMPSTYLSGRFCRGEHCFRYSFLMLMCVVICISAVQFMNLFMLHRKDSNSRVQRQLS